MSTPDVEFGGGAQILVCKKPIQWKDDHFTCLKAEFSIETVLFSIFQASTTFYYPAFAYYLSLSDQEGHDKGDRVPSVVDGWPGLVAAYHELGVRLVLIRIFNLHRAFSASVAVLLFLFQ